MANADHLLREAQFAFSNISFGESPGNKRNAARAKSLCMKILRKFPGTMEAQEAHAILMRLGDEAFTSKMSAVHRHQSQEVHHEAVTTVNSPSAGKTRRIPLANGATEALDWGGLFAMVLALPKTLLATIAIGGILLFGLFGPFLLIPLVALVLFIGPFRKTLKPGQREKVNAFIVRTNEYIDKQR